jgi:hypothetical protein
MSCWFNGLSHCNIWNARIIGHDVRQVAEEKKTIEFLPVSNASSNASTDTFHFRMERRALQAIRRV